VGGDSHFLMDIPLQKQLKLAQHWEKISVSSMSKTTAFVAELVRAANETGSLSPFEVRRLLDRAISTIRDLREDVGIIPIKGRDALIYVETVAAGADRVPEEEWHHGLLHAAEMIRDLHIVLDLDTRISVFNRPSNHAE